MASLVILFVAPSIWAATTLWGADSQYPFAGPELVALPFAADHLPDVRKLDTYLEAHHHGERFLAATLEAKTAAPLILTTGDSILAMGGYNGGDHILSAGQLAALVQQDQVRFFLLPDNYDPQDDTLVRWVTDHCAHIDLAAWSPPSGGNPFSARTGGPQELFDCLATST